MDNISILILLEPIEQSLKELIIQLKFGIQLYSTLAMLSIPPNIPILILLEPFQQSLKELIIQLQLQLSLQPQPLFQIGHVQTDAHHLDFFLDLGFVLDLSVDLYLRLIG